MLVVVSPIMLSSLRYCLKKAIPGTKSSHIAEAVAASLGFKSNIALKAWVDDSDEVYSPRKLEVANLLARLNGLVGSHRFELIWDPDRPHEKRWPDLLPTDFDVNAPEKLRGALRNLLVDRSYSNGEPKDKATKAQHSESIDVLVPLLKWLHENRGIDFDVKGLLGITLQHELCAIVEDKELPEGLERSLSRYLSKYPDPEKYKAIESMILWANFHRRDVREDGFNLSGQSSYFRDIELNKVANLMAAPLSTKSDIDNRVMVQVMLLPPGRCFRKDAQIFFPRIPVVQIENCSIPIVLTQDDNGWQMPEYLIPRETH